MRDWERFVEHTPWFVEGEVVVGAVSPWAREPVDALPILSTLLTGATVTEVTVGGHPYELLFAPDHAFPRVTPLPGCPEYSLMTIDDVPDLATWIEESSAVWLD